MYVLLLAGACDCSLHVQVVVLEGYLFEGFAHVCG